MQDDSSVDGAEDVYETVTAAASAAQQLVEEYGVPHKRSYVPDWTEQDDEDVLVAATYLQNIGRELNMRHADHGSGGRSTLLQVDGRRGYSHAAAIGAAMLDAYDDLTPEQVPALVHTAVYGDDTPDNSVTVEEVDLETFRETVLDGHDPETVLAPVEAQLDQQRIGDAPEMQELWKAYAYVQRGREEDTEEVYRDVNTV